MKRSIQWPLTVSVLFGGIVLGRWAGPSFVQGQFAPPVTNIPKEMTSFRDVVKAVVPAVVSIEPKAAGSRSTVNVPEEFRRYYEQPGRRPPFQDLGFGSGFIVDPTGVILTNYHVVEGADSLDITLADGRRFVSRDFKGDKHIDIAVVRIKSDTPLPALQFGDSSDMEVGDRVLAVGAPFGLTGSVTHGIISAKERDIKLNPRQFDGLIQTDAAINPGSSGGPLVNLAGQVVGVTSAIKSYGKGFQGVSMAISGNQASNAMQQLLKNGVVKRGYLGIEMARPPLGDDSAEDGSKKEIVVSRVLDKTPAAKAGLKVNDVILAIDGKAVREQRHLQRLVAELPLNKPVKIDILRDSKPMQLSLTIEEAPQDYAK